jgi:ketosteroid isomerase-like protein
MSEEAVEAVRRAFQEASRVSDPSGRRMDVLNRKSLDIVFQSFDPEIEVREDPRFPEAGLFRGREAARSYFEQFTESFDEFSFEAEDFIDLGDDQVLVLFRLRTRGKESGANVEARPGWIYTIRNGKAVRIEAYVERSEALAAAGLETHDRPG